MNLKNLGIRTKLMGGFGLVLVIALVQSLLAMQQLHEVNNKSTDIAENWLPSVKVLGELNADLAELRMSRVQLTALDEAGKVAEAEQLMVKLQDQMLSDAAVYAKLISSPEEKAQFDDLEREMKAYIAIGPKLAALMRDLKAPEAKAITQGEGARAYKAANTLLDKLVELNAKGASQASAEADAIYSRGRFLLFIGLAVMIALGLGIAWARPPVRSTRPSESPPATSPSPRKPTARMRWAVC